MPKLAKIKIEKDIGGDLKMPKWMGSVCETKKYMSHKKKKIMLSKKEVLHSFNSLGEIEEAEGVELPERMHELAEKPTKLPKKIRSSPKESYLPMHGGRR